MGESQAKWQQNHLILDHLLSKAKVCGNFLSNYNESFLHVAAQTVERRVPEQPR